MLIRKPSKFILSCALIIGLIAPSSAFASSSYEKDLDLKYGPQNGSVRFVESAFSPMSTFGRIFYTANFKVTTHFQIPKDIKIKNSDYNTLRILSEGKPNTNSSDEYKVDLEYYSAWNGNYVGADSVTVPMDMNRYSYFYDLSTDKTYRLRIVGNVQGKITAYEQTS